MKVVLNVCFGGFGLSQKAQDYLGLDFNTRYKYNDYYNRTAPELIECIEELGSFEASGKNAKLAVIEIPDGIEWEIYDHDGFETIHEKHRVWSV